MKRFIGMLFGVLMVMVGVFSSCDKNEELNQVPQTETKETRASALRSASALSYGMHIVGPLPYADPLHGRPNETTYKFYVANPPSDLQGVVIVFSTPAGGKVTRVMQKNSAGNFFHEQTLSQSGRYEVKYLLRYRTPKAEKTVVPASGFIDNTLVNFDGTTKKLVWPFGADRSSWNNRIGLYGQRWHGGQEGGSGNGYGQGGHVGVSEYYSDDWNRGSGDQDNGAVIRSPLDGIVEEVSSQRIKGQLVESKYVAIVQKTASGKVYRFYVSHLKEQGVKKGQYVQAGVTVIGLLGNTGTKYSHAHCNLRDVTNGKKVSVPFDFSAQWSWFSWSFYYLKRRSIFLLFYYFDKLWRK